MSKKFKIDENLPVEIAGLLRENEFRVKTVLEEELGGLSDADLSKRCKEENRIFITLDLDFADIKSYPPEEYPGLIVLRPTRQNKSHLLKLFKSLLSRLKKVPIKNKLWIVEENKIRIHDS